MARHGLACHDLFLCDGAVKAEHDLALIAHPARWPCIYFGNDSRIFFASWRLTKIKLESFCRAS
jgi:hypothetical protein